MSSTAAFFSFPSIVNEKTARAVAGQVALVAAVTLLLALAVDDRWLWVSAPLALGFLLRVLTGPRVSPFALLAAWVIASRLGAAKLVPGTPKRFAQGMGFAMTGAATVCVALGLPGAAEVLVAMLVVAATLESVFALCLGCKIFALGMRIGLVPESACPECADISLRRSAQRPDQHSANHPASIGA